MYASFLPSLLQAALVTVAPGPDDGCPSAQQVQAAIASHAPRLLAPHTDDSSANQLTLSMGSTPGSRDVTLSLLDGKGRIRLYRALPAPPGDRSPDCAALAHTVAFIVDRYFDEVELPAAPERKLPPAPPSPPPTPPSPPPAPPSPPPPSPAPPAPTPAPPPPPPAPVAPPPPAPAPAPPPPPPASPPVLRSPPASPVAAAGTTAAGQAPRAFQLSASAGRRLPGSAIDLGGIELKLTLGVRLARLGRGRLPLTAELSGGIIGIVSRGWKYGEPGPVAEGSANAVRSGGDLALLLGWPSRWGTVYAGPLFALELVWLDATSAGRQLHETHAGTAVGGRTGYRYAWRDRFFLRADVTVAAALLRQRIVTASRPDIAIFEAPAGYATISLGAGVWF